MNQTLKKYLTLIVLGLAGGSIYIFPYLKYVFYNPLIHVLHISNAQSGMLLTMYAIGCVILYIPGGILADKVNPKKALILSLLATSALTIIFAPRISSIWNFACYLASACTGIRFCLLDGTFKSNSYYWYRRRTGTHVWGILCGKWNNSSNYCSCKPLGI